MLLRLMGALGLLFLFQVSFPSDTADTLRERYGQPISQNFLVRPGIVASASYGPSGHVCEIVLRPQRLWNSTLEDIQVNGITDELVPRSERGKVATGGFIDGICPTNDCDGVDYEWEKVSIIRWGTSNQIHYETIRWHRDECRPG